MSDQTRQAVANSRNLLYQDDCQAADLLSEDRTQTQLIAALQHLLEQGWTIEVTAIRSDHHDDTGLDAVAPYVGTHAHGWAIDFWPMNPDDTSKYLDAADPHFQKFLTDCSHVPYYFQTGLGGSANTELNQVAAGAAWFPDDGDDHVHLGTQQ